MYWDKRQHLFYLFGSSMLERSVLVREVRHGFHTIHHVHATIVHIYRCQSFHVSLGIGSVYESPLADDGDCGESCEPLKLLNS